MAESASASEKPGSTQPDQTATASSIVPLWLLILGVAGFIFFLVQRDAVFPNAALTLKVPKSEIQRLAAGWADKVGYGTTDVLKSTVFNHDSNGKTFLEMELGINQANEVMRGDNIPIWHWRTRFCKELKSEEMRVFLSPAGALTSFTRDFDNDHALPSVSRADAQQLAETFIKTQTNVQLQNYKLIESSDKTHTKRVDHSFTWERTMPDLHGGSLRVSASVAGNEVSAFNAYLKVPEAWQVKYRSLRSYNNMLWRIANVFYVLLQCTVACLLIREIGLKSIRWRFAAKVAAALAIGFLLATVNSWDSIFDGYATSISVSQFLINQLFYCCIGTIGVFFACILMIGISESFYRRNYPSFLAAESYFRKNAFSTKQMSAGLCAGVSLFAVGLGWQIAYYLLGEHYLHFYSPLGLSNYELLNGFAPFFFAITIGVIASLSEEVLYRVFALTLLTKSTRNFWLANLLQAAAWGFMHSTYNQQPCYVRGLELTCWGMVEGWVMRRFGLLPCVVAHYLFDAFLESDVLLRSSVVPLQLTGLIPVLPLIVMAVISWLLSRKSAAPDEELLNGFALDTVPVALTKPADAEPVYEGYTSLPRRTRQLLLASIIICAPAIVVLWYSDIPTGGRSVLAIDHNEAISLAKKVLADRGLEAGKYWTCAHVTGETGYHNLGKYATEQIGKLAAKNLIERCSDGFDWGIRFFQPENRIEYNVWLNGQGKLTHIWLTFPEEGNGASLTPAQAQVLAERRLNEIKPSPTPLVFQSVSNQKRPNRTDFTFEYAAPALRLGQADAKLSVYVLGDQVSGPSSISWQLPDKWRFEEQKVSHRQQIASIIRSVFYTGFGLAAAWAAFGIIRGVTLHWRIPLMVAAVNALSMLVQDVNGLVDQNWWYQTSQPYFSFVIDKFMSYLTSLIAPFVGTLIASSLAIACCQLLLPRFHWQHFLRAAFLPDNQLRQIHRDLWIDALLAGTSFAFLAALIHTIFYNLGGYFDPYIQIDDLSKLCDLNGFYSGFLDRFIDRLREGCSTTIGLGLAAGMYAKYCSKPRFFLIFALVSCLVATGDYKHVQDVILSGGEQFCTLMAGWFFVTRVAKTNILAYFIYGMSMKPLADLLTYINQTTPHFLPEAILTSAIPLLPLLYLVYLLSSTSSQSAQPDIA